MFIKYTDGYNPKIDFLVLKYLNPKYNSKKNYNELKSIFYKSEKAKSVQGEYLERLIRIYDVLKKNDFNKDVFIKCSNILNSDITEEKLKKFLNFYELLENNKDGLIEANSVEILLYLIRNKVLNKNNDCFAVLVFNAYLIKNNYVPFIFYHYNLDYIKKKVESNVRVRDLKFYLDTCYNENKVFLNKYKPLSKNKLVKILKSQEDEIIQNYYVEKMWIYGSFARDEANEYSDVDIYLEISEYDTKNIIKFKKYLEKLLLRKVDFHIEKFQKYTFFNNIYEERELILSKKGVIENVKKNR